MLRTAVSNALIDKINGGKQRSVLTFKEISLNWGNSHLFKDVFNSSSFAHD
jgi:hypothetical protein